MERTRNVFSIISLYSFILICINSSTTTINAGGIDLELIKSIEDEGWVSCSKFPQTSSLPNCLCQQNENEEFSLNCDHVVFSTDFPNLPFRKSITHFSHRYVNSQNLPPQAFIPSGIPLQSLDLSHNWLRRLSDKSLDGLSQTLQKIDLSFNLLGDQLNPIFSTAEFKKLPRLKILNLAHNQIGNIDSGILEGCLSLQELFVNGNDLRSVPSAALKGPNALRVLDLSSNEIEDLSDSGFLEQPSMIFLNLSHNKISGIGGNSFRGLGNLKMLDLSWNRIHRLNSDPFNGLITIEELELSNNYLTQIPITALKPLETLRRLKLSANLIQNLEGTSLKSMRNLEGLDLSRNRISDIPKGFFAGISSLKSLNLGVNQLRTLSGSAFEGLKELRDLNLMDNNLLAFPSIALNPLSTLSSLTLDYNRISALNPMKIQNLTLLSLSHNLVRDIPSDTFTNFPKLAHLDLSANLISNIDELLLPNSIETLNFASNKIKNFPRFPLPSLKKLNLEKNEMGVILEHNFVLLSSLEKLDLSSNDIRSYSHNSFDGLENLRSLDISKNKILTIPKFGNLLQLVHLNFSHNGLKEVGSIENMENLKMLDLSSNEISNLKPSSFPNTTNLVALYLRNNKLSSFKGFSEGMKKLRILDLGQNEITYVYPNSFENLGSLWDLDLSSNSFTFFPTEFLKDCTELRKIELAQNAIKSLNEMSFSNFPHLVQVDLSGNALEALLSNAFLNSSQIQLLDFSGNKIESIEADLFHGLYRLELDLSNNYLSSLPSNIFDRSHVQKLNKIDLAKNAFEEIPSDSLQKQYFFLETLNLSENRISQVAPNLNILVNVKTLDLSSNPLSQSSLKIILNEPKTARSLNLANTGLSSLPIVEMPFLNSLNLSGNPISNFQDEVFGRTTLLKSLCLARTNFHSLDLKFPPSLNNLDLSGTQLSSISGSVFPPYLRSIKLNDLLSLTKVEKSSLNLKHLEKIELTNLPKLGYLDIRGLLTQLLYLEEFDFEVKDHQIVDQIHPGLNPRVKSIGLRGKRVRVISTGAFAGLTSPSVRISLTNTSLTILPSILVPVPMSSQIILDLTGSRISNLSPPFLTEKIRLQGLSPICDCNAHHLVKYIQNIEDDVKCSGPPSLDGASVLKLNLSELICESGSSTSTTPVPLPSTLSTTLSTEDDIIWSLPPSTRRPSSKKDKSKNEPSSSTPSSNKGKISTEINNMDNLIIGIVGGVVALIVLFVSIIVCFVKMSGGGGGGGGGGNEYGLGAASVISVPAYAPSTKCTCPHKGDGGRVHVGGHHGGILMPASYATVRSGKSVHAITPYPGVHSMYPYSTMTLAQAQGALLGNYNYGGTVRPHPQIQQQQQQQQQLYGSLPYFVHDEFERR